MATVLRQGWQVDDPNKSSSVIKAKVYQAVPAIPGGQEQVEIVSNIETGNFDIYETRLIGPRPDKPIFSYNASNDKIIVVSQDAFNKYYSGTSGREQLTALVKSAKLATFDTAQINTGTDPTRNQSFNNLKSKSGYKSLANSAKPGERVPGAEPNSGSSETLTGPESPTDQGTTSQPLTDENLKVLEKGIAGRKYREQYSDLFYPENIGKTTSDVIKFTMVRYGTKSLSTETLSFGSRDLTEILGSVTMSIQPTISDYNAVNWNPSEMNPLAQGAAAASLEFIDTGSVEGVTKLLQKTKDVEDENLKKAIITAIAQEAAGAKGLLTRLTGAMFNNNLELLFQGPQLRQFGFTFKLSPRSKSEAEMVRKIIRFFKQGSAVQRSVANLFLKSPNVFKLEYIYGKSRKSHRSLNKIKTCALVNVAVDYTPTGSYMTYEEDGSMVSYNLTLTFNELEPVYEDEYDTDDSSGIGY